MSIIYLLAKDKNYLEGLVDVDFKYCLT